MILVLCSLISRFHQSVKNLRDIMLAFLFTVFAPVAARAADWTPIVSTDDFTGPQADLMTVIGGTMLISLVVMAAMLVRNMLTGGR